MKAIEAFLLREMMNDSNWRDLKGFHDVLNPYCSNFRWFRRWVGGKWELWSVDVIHGNFWHPVTDWSEGRKKPAPLCRTRLSREEHEKSVSVEMK